MLAAFPQTEILDLRHFSAPALRPLLQREADCWQRRLQWDYSRSIELLLEYIDNRSLTGYVAMQRGRVAGYAFGVCEAAKAVVGDVFAFGEGEQQSNPVCELLLTHLLETLQATPGVGRIESQLLLFPSGAFRQQFLERGFHSFHRIFMVRELHSDDAPHPASSNGSDAADTPGYRLERWRPEAYVAAADLIQKAYTGHTDADINDQYRTLAGAQRFLHNIVQFPGCGTFDAANSLLLRDTQTNELAALILCSRVRQDAAHITQLCVREQHRGRGLGAHLLRHCLQQLKECGLNTASLTVTSTNRQALRLYAHQGFQSLHAFEAYVWDARAGR